jgi:hypothetical protein
MMSVVGSDTSPVQTVVREELLANPDRDLVADLETRSEQ